MAEYSDGDVYEYAYDEVGNRQALTTTEGASTYTTTYQYDEANPVWAPLAPQRRGGERPLDVGGWSVVYLG